MATRTTSVRSNCASRHAPMALVVFAPMDNRLSWDLVVFVPFEFANEMLFSARCQVGIASTCPNGYSCIVGSTGARPFSMPTCFFVLQVSPCAVKAAARSVHHGVSHSAIRRRDQHSRAVRASIVRKGVIVHNSREKNRTSQLRVRGGAWRFR